MINGISGMNYGSSLGYNSSMSGNGVEGVLNGSGNNNEAGNSGVKGIGNNSENAIINGIGKDGGNAGKNGSIAGNGDKEDEKVKNGKSSPEDCETCKNRKYQDGSDEMVSFKAAAHISPEAAGAAVRAHEGEHVTNAYNKAAENDGKVVNASVRIFTSVCPECGRTYVSGGVTDTTIKYSNEENPYMKNFKAQQATVLTGQNVDRKE